MIVLKVVSDEALADRDPMKCHDIYPIPPGWKVTFSRDKDTRCPRVVIRDIKGKVCYNFIPEGNCYLMDGGTTFDCFRADQKWR